MSKHIRFDNQDDDDGSIDSKDNVKTHEFLSFPENRLTNTLKSENLRENIESKTSRIIEAIKVESNYDINESHDPIIEEPITEDIKQPQQNSTAMEEIRQNVDELNLPQQNNLPKENDVIAFKYLKIGNDYMPKLTDYIIGMVESIDEENKNLKIYILAGNEETKKPNGKFHVPDFDDDDDDDDQDNSDNLVLNWNDMHSVRVVNV